MEKEGHSVICSTDAKRPKDGSENLAISPHRSRRLEEKAKALNKCRLSLEDLLCNVDKRNEKFGYVVTNIGSLKSDYSPSKTFSDHCPRTCKKGYMTTTSSSDLLYDHCKSVCNDQEVFAQGGNSSYPGDLHGRRCTNYSERTLCSRVARQTNLKTESSAVGDISKSQKNIEPVQRRLRRTRSCANLSDLRYSDADNSCNKSFMSVICEDSSKEIDLGDKAHPVKIETASNTSVVSFDSQMKGHSTKGFCDQGLVKSSVFSSDTTTVHGTTDCQSRVGEVINEGNLFLSQHHEEQSKNLTATSILESESTNESVVEINVKSKSSQEPLLLAENNQSEGEVSSSDNVVVIEERETLSSQGTNLINPTKITLRNSKDCSAVLGDEESSAVLLTKKSLAKMKTQAKCSEEDKIDHSEHAMNESEVKREYIIISSSSQSSLRSPLYSGSLARHVKLNKSGVAVINVLKSSFPPQRSVLIQPIQKSANSSLKAALLNERGSASAISGNDSTCNQFSKEALAAGAEKHERLEVGRSPVEKIRVTEERKETSISTPKSEKEGHPSSESPEVLCLGIAKRSRGDSATYSINTQKHSPVKNINIHSRNTVANAAVRNLFKKEKRSNDANLFNNECKLVQKVDQKNNSICNLENDSNEELEVVDKSVVELKGIFHSSPKELKLSKISETDERQTSDSKFISRNEIPSMSLELRNTGSFVFDVDEDLEKCEDDVLSRHQKGDYSCGFTGFKDTSQITHSRVPVVVLERLPSWIVKDRTIKLTHETSELKETVQQLIDSRISEEEILNRKEEVQLRRKYKSMSDLSALIHYDLQQEKELVGNRRRITRSFGEEIKIDYTAKLPDERDVKFKKPENDEHLPFFGFNIPFGFLGLPDHYLVYRSIINKSKKLGFQIDPNLGTGNLVEKSESLYFMGDCNPFRSRPMVPQVEREKISPTKILEIASVNRNIHSQYSKSQQRSESHDAFFPASPEKIQEVENLTIEFEQGPSMNSASNLSKKQIPRHSPSNHSYSAVDSSSQYLECGANLINVAEDDKSIKQTESEGSACGKDFCRLGCICESLEVRERVKEHCGHEGCMFSSFCLKNSSKSSSGRTKMSILKHIGVSSSEEELVRSKRKRKLPARLLQEEIICSPLSLGGKKQCCDSNISLLHEEKSRKITECSVVLNRFHLSGANVRCLYHFRQNCPCLKDKLLEKPRNVALKSTSGRLQLNSQIIVGHSQIHQHGGYFRTLESDPVFNTPKDALKSSLYKSGMNQYRSTIIYPQSPSKVNGSNSFSNGIIDSADSLVMREDLNRGGTLRYFFNNMAEFQHTLSQGKMKCSDLEKICSESLTYLPKGAVQIMKLTLLKEMLRKELAYLWMMHLPRGRTHVFLSKENKAPGVACQRVRDLDELSKLPSHVMSLFASSEKYKDHLMSCIQISQSYFWQITGTISFIKNNVSTSKPGSVVTNITDSRPIWSAGTQKKMPKGPNPVNFISSGSCNYKATNTSSNLKKLKVISPSTSNLFSRTQLSNVAAKSQPSVSSITLTSDKQSADYQLWYNLDLHKPFDELRVKTNNFRITRLRLQQLFSLARSRKSFIRVSFGDRESQPRRLLPAILVHPNEKNYSVKIGPFTLNKPTGVKTYKNVNGNLIETNSYLTISRIVAREKMFRHLHNLEGQLSKIDEEGMWENFKPEKITQNVNKASEVTKMINPKVSEIVSTKDADPGLTIVIQDVQGHYDTFNDIPSPTKCAVPLEGASDAPETWLSGSTVSYVGEYNVNESEISHEIISDASEPLLTSSHYSVSDSNALIGSVNSVTKDNHSLHDSSTMHHAADSEVIATEINPVSNYFKIPSETILNHEELILKEEPNSDPLDEYDCDPLACSSEEILPDVVENSGQYDWSGTRGLREIVVENSNVMNSSPSSVPKTTTVKKKSSILSDLKRRSSSLSKRSILKRNILSPKSRKLPQSPGEPINTHGNIETGYLIPDVPGIQPIPVARGGMTELESKAITMKNPMSKDGKLLHILDLELANLFLNEAVLQRVNFFPSNMKINWAFVRVDGVASKENFDGLMNLGDLTTNMFITPKGVFLYDEAVKSRSVLQRCGIGAESLHRFMETRRRRQIISIKKHLADLLGKKGNTLISTICFAQQEIKKLKAKCGELENQIYHERCLKTSLMSRLREVASDKERVAVMESLKLLKRETDVIPTERIEEDGKDNWSLGDSSGNYAPRQVKGRKGWTRKRICTGNKDGDWIPQGSKKNNRARKTEGYGNDCRKKISSVKNKSQLKPQSNTAFSSQFQKQLRILKKHIISSNNYRSKGLGSTSKACNYSILKNAKSVKAAADAEANRSPIENEESILSSGSDDVDIETFEDDFKVNN